MCVCVFHDRQSTGSVTSSSTFKEQQKHSLLKHLQDRSRRLNWFFYFCADMVCGALFLAWSADGENTCWRTWLQVSVQRKQVGNIRRRCLLWDTVFLFWLCQFLWLFNLNLFSNSLQFLSRPTLSMNFSSMSVTPLFLQFLYSSNKCVQNSHLGL